MSNQFLLADVGRDIVSGGGLGTITGYTDPTTVTVEIKQAFPAAQIDAGAWVILGTPQTTCTPSAKDPVGATITLTLSTNGWRADDVGKFVRINGGLCKITVFTSDLVVSATVETALNAVTGAPALAWTLEGATWSDVLGWPRCGTRYQQRLWVAGTPSFPQTFWGSSIGAPRDFTLGTDDDMALAYTIDADQQCTIRHLSTASGLVLMTSGGVFSVRGGQEKPITPTNIDVDDQFNLGCTQVAPVRVVKELFFVQQAGRKIRATAPSEFDSEDYLAPDISVLSEHITESGIVSMAYLPEPEPQLMAVRADGQLATLTPDRDQGVFAWVRQLTQGNFESVCCVPTPSGGKVFAIVARVLDGVTTRYMETFETGLHTDCCITGSTDTATAVWAGLDHLEGRVVVAKGDGVYLGEFTVGGGEITLPRTALSVEIGLPYTTTVKTLTPEYMTQGGSSQGAQLSINEVRVRLLETIGCNVNLQVVAFRQFGLGVLDQPPTPFTGDKKAGNLSWADGIAQTLIQQVLPYDFRLLAVITHITANGP